MTQYCGILITDTNLYVSVTQRLETGIKVMQRYMKKRGSNLAFDLADIHRNNKTIPTMYAIVYKEEPQLILQTIDTHEPFKLAMKLKENLSLENFPNYAYEFMLPTIDNQQWLYIVGISRDKLKEVSVASDINQMETEVVSYWPAPLLDLHEGQDDPVLLLVEENDIVTGYLCSKHMVLAETVWDKQIESPKQMINRIIANSPIKIDERLRIQAYLTDSSYLVWKALITQYGEVQTDAIPDVVNHFTHRWRNNMYMDTTAGLSYYLARMGFDLEGNDDD